jgi:[calcium/calmodulin-dependent protein kinase] kinase
MGFCLDSHELLVAEQRRTTPLDKALSPRWKAIKRRWVTTRSEHRWRNEINQYRLGELLGQGSFGSVLKAVDQRGGNYAFKTILRRGEHEKALRACNILRSVQHQNVVNLTEIINDSTRPEIHVVLEYCDRGQAGYWDAATRQYTQEDGSFMQSEKLSCFVLHVASGLQHLHRNLIAHRDIKPDNILVSSGSAPDTLCFKIGDFSESTRFGSDNRDGIMTETKGTYHFFTPEAVSTLEGFSCYGGDVWALGVSIYALAFGSLPFDNTDLIELFEQIEECQPKQRPLDADSALCGLIDQILEKDPSSRIGCEGIIRHSFVAGAGMPS